MSLEGEGRDRDRRKQRDRPRDRALGPAKAGANIAIDYVAHPEATDALEGEISKPPWAPWPIGGKADVSRIAELQMLIDATVAKFGGSTSW